LTAANASLMPDLTLPCNSASALCPGARLRASKNVTIYIPGEAGVVEWMKRSAHTREALRCKEYEPVYATIFHYRVTSTEPEGVN